MKKNKRKWHVYSLGAVFMFIYIITMGPVPTGAVEGELDNVLQNKCTQRCDILYTSCSEYFGELEPSKASIGKKLCQYIFRSKTAYCSSLCKNEPEVFADCENETEIGYEYDIEDCHDFCESHNAKCVLGCSDQNKNIEDTKKCWHRCSIMFSDENSFCKASLCENNIEDIVMCE
ncbi:hypothetical protein KJ708_12575 [bacterium]|nr:hypothetical protein [bacterium]MBU1917325.1 hypothetical protein [bacterium]